MGGRRPSLIILQFHVQPLRIYSSQGKSSIKFPAMNCGSNIFPSNNYFPHISHMKLIFASSVLIIIIAEFFKKKVKLLFDLYKMSLGNRLTIDVPGHRIHPHSVLFAGYECVCTRASRRMFRKELMRSGAAGACTNTVGWWLNSQQPAAAAVDSIGRVPTLFSCCIAPMLSSASPLIHTHTLDVVCQQICPCIRPWPAAAARSAIQSCPDGFPSSDALSTQRRPACPPV